MFHSIFILSILSWVLFEVWVMIRERGETDKSKDQNTKRDVLVYIFIAIIIGNVFANIPYFLIPVNLPDRFIIGSVLIWLGILLRFWAIQTLGEFFRTTVMIQKAHKVVNTGPYKFIRHPSYTAGLIILFGIGFGMGNYIGLILMLLLSWYGYGKRITVEEAELSRSLGNPYRDYMKQTKRLIPFLY